MHVQSIILVTVPFVDFVALVIGVVRNFELLQLWAAVTLNVLWKLHTRVLTFPSAPAVVSKMDVTLSTLMLPLSAGFFCSYSILGI